MRAGFFQYDVVRDREENWARISRAIKNETFDLLVLPELFTSGYAFDRLEDLLPFVERLDDSPTVRELTSLAKISGGCITGTLPERDGNQIYNTAIMVSPDGLIGIHRKIHLPDYEKRFFSAGNAIDVTTYKGINMGMMVCFDCWFAPLGAKLRQLKSHVVCHSSCFGGDVTPGLVPVRALENQYFVISCNRIGTELFDGEPEDYRGESQIVDPDGHVLYKAGREESLTLLDLDLTHVNNPAFGGYITKDFTSEHDRYSIKTRLDGQA